MLINRYEFTKQNVGISILRDKKILKLTNKLKNFSLSKILLKSF